MVQSVAYIGAVVVFVLTYVFWRFYQWRKDLPPGPPCIPLIGNLGMVEFSDSVSEFNRLRKKYGDVFCFVVGIRPVVVVNGVEALREIFVKNADVTSVRPVDFMFSKLSNWKGIIGSNGDLWKEHRIFALKSFRDLRYGKRSFESQIQPQVETLMEILDKKHGLPFDITERLKFCIINIMFSITMGKTFVANDEKMLYIITLNKRLLSDPVRRGVASYLPFREHIPGDPFHIKDSIQFWQKVDRFFQDMIDEHKQTLDKDNIRDYVDAYLIEKDSQSSNPNSTFDDEQLIQTLQDFFLAGLDTVVTALLWIILQLIHHPDVQNKLRREIDQVVATSMLPSLSQKPDLPYTEAVITETLRLNSVAPLSAPHGVLSDVYWKGYRIPVGTQVIPNVRSVDMDPNIFPNPEKFDPGRFLDDDGKFNGQSILVPFGIGPRVCLGEKLAKMQLFLFLTAIVQRFELFSEDPNNLPSMKGVLGITYHPLPYKLKAIPRN